MKLPEELILCQKPDGYISKEYKLTVGKKYKVHGEMGSCVIIDTDEQNVLASIHWSRFFPYNA